MKLLLVASLALVLALSTATPAGEFDLEEVNLLPAEEEVLLIQREERATTCVDKYNNCNDLSAYCNKWNPSIVSGCCVCGGGTMKPVVVPNTSPSCKDKYSNCDELSAYCNDQNPNIMSGCCACGGGTEETGGSGGGNSGNSGNSGSSGNSDNSGNSGSSGDNTCTQTINAGVTDDSDCVDAKPSSCFKKDYCCEAKYRTWLMGDCKRYCGFCKWDVCDPHSAGKDNTMCKYPEGQFGSKCGSTSSVQTGPMSQQQKQAVLDRHNKLRQKVASGQESGLPGGNIPDLKWDDGLAEVAQRWGDQCPGGSKPHDDNRATKKFPAGAGQNLYTSWSSRSSGISSTDFTNAIQAWYDEVMDFTHYGCNYKKFSNNCISGKKSTIPGFTSHGAQIGHFTQVIWAETTYVGCGWIKYRSNGMYTTSVVCNYGAAGNMGGAAIY